MPQPQHPDEMILPIEVTSRRDNLDIVSKTMEVYSLHSPSLETARKQSIISDVPASVGGDGQLARVAAHIQERVKHRFFASDKFPRHSPKEPPDKPFGLTAMGAAWRHLDEDVVSAIITRSAMGHPLQARTGFVPVLEPNLALAGRRCFPKGLSSPISTIIAQNLSMPREINQMEREMCLRSRPRSKVPNAQVLKPPDRATLRQFLNEIVSKLECRRRNWTSYSHSRLARTHPLPPVVCCAHTAPQIGETPSAGGTEHGNKHSIVGKRLAAKQALASSSAEAKEGWPVAVRLSVSAPAALPVLLASTVPPRQPPNGQTPLSLSVQHAAPVLFRLPESANFLQTMLSSQLSSELVVPFPKPSDDEDYKRRPLKVISLSNTLSTEWHSPGSKTSAPRPVSKLDIMQACLSYSPSLERWWQECYKLPNGAVVIQECVSDVNGPAARLKPDQRWAVSATRRPGLELVWRVLKPPDRMAVRRPLNKVVIKHELRRGHSHSPNGGWFIADMNPVNI